MSIIFLLNHLFDLYCLLSIFVWVQLSFELFYFLAVEERQFFGLMLGIEEMYEKAEDHLFA